MFSSFRQLISKCCFSLPTQLDFEYLHKQAVLFRGLAVPRLTRAVPGTVIITDQNKCRYVTQLVCLQ